MFTAGVDSETFRREVKTIRLIKPDRNEWHVEDLCQTFRLIPCCGLVEILKPPCDIKLTNEYIYVLSSINPFLYSFNYNLTTSALRLLALRGWWTLCVRRRLPSVAWGHIG